MRAYEIYKRRKNPNNLENFKHVSLLFKEHCNTYYHEEKKASEWVKIIYEKWRNENEIHQGISR